MQAPPDDRGYTPPKKPSYLWLWIVVGALLVCGCGGLLILPAILFPVFSETRLAAQRTNCLTNVRELGRATSMYAADYDDKLPEAANWSESIAKNVPRESAFNCPALRRSGGQYGYAVNSTIAGRPAASAGPADTTVWIFETARLEPNASGDPASEAPPNRHGRGRSESYLDTHVSFKRSSAR